ncbi:hypothetical protein O9G_003521 [Rozella allomycis CSF55]|uniref:Uncharacterized protein n=1 Tax=Rozella allomycis (strain CSF55) TaxID=988480 RepID=A0A075AU55_ROZAC|nr:hypothetical protein O9G_003521 [Rozella allomycis CSF55]|eukprot:EPZ32057.1 hypothetical protein O9G_003521 [Rozella allomycis CSF55]
MLFELISKYISICLYSTAREYRKYNHLSFKVTEIISQLENFNRRTNQTTLPPNFPQCTVEDALNSCNKILSRIRDKNIWNPDLIHIAHTLLPIISYFHKTDKLL